jgi:hypothetical protein
VRKLRGPGFDSPHLHHRGGPKGPPRRIGWGFSRRGPGAAGRPGQSAPSRGPRSQATKAARISATRARRSGELTFRGERIVDEVALVDEVFGPQRHPGLFDVLIRLRGDLGMITERSSPGWGPSASSAGAIAPESTAPRERSGRPGPASPPTGCWLTCEPSIWRRRCWRAAAFPSRSGSRGSQSPGSPEAVGAANPPSPGRRPARPAAGGAGPGTRRRPRRRCGRSGPGPPGRGPGLAGPPGSCRRCNRRSRRGHRS